MEATRPVMLLVPVLALLSWGGCAGARSDVTSPNAPESVAETTRRAEESIERVELPPPDPPRSDGGGERTDPADLPAAYLIDEVRFATGSATLDGTARTTLRRLVERLRSAPAGYRIELHGHADASGSSDLNRRLAGARAEAVRRFLQDRADIEPDRLLVLNMGAAAPASDNDTDSGRGLNRRVEIVVFASHPAPFEEQSRKPGQGLQGSSNGDLPVTRLSRWHTRCTTGPDSRTGE